MDNVIDDNNDDDVIDDYNDDDVVNSSDVYDGTQKAK